MFVKSDVHSLLALLQADEVTLANLTSQLKPVQKKKLQSALESNISAIAQSAVGAWIRRDDERKILELREKLAAAKTEYNELRLRLATAAEVSGTNNRLEDSMSDSEEQPTEKMKQEDATAMARWTCKLCKSSNIENTAGTYDFCRNCHFPRDPAKSRPLQHLKICRKCGKINNLADECVCSKFDRHSIPVKPTVDKVKKQIAADDSKVKWNFNPSTSTLSFVGDDKQVDSSNSNVKALKIEDSSSKNDSRLLPIRSIVSKPRTTAVSKREIIDVESFLEKANTNIQKPTKRVKYTETPLQPNELRKTVSQYFSDFAQDKNNTSLIDVLAANETSKQPDIDNCKYAAFNHVNPLTTRRLQIFQAFRQANKFNSQ